MPLTKTPSRQSLHNWGIRHLQVAIAALGRMSRSPASTLMTATVIGIALSMPAGLYSLLSNVQSLSGSWGDAATISLFLKHDISDKKAKQLAQQLRKDNQIAEIHYIGKQEALEEFQRFSGFGQVLKNLETNPLPAVLVIQPTIAASSAFEAEALTTRLQKLTETESVQLDLQWVRRFHAITEIAQRAVLVIGTILSLAVLLIIGNTIRLEIQHRHQEIEITKLVGATDNFIRRPFLYSGLWYGVLGGLIAWFLVVLSLWLLTGPIQRLAGLYQSDFGLEWLNFSMILILLATGSLLGLGGAWLSVSRHLSSIEPS